MPRPESPDAQFDRLKSQLQNSILSDYPNPERKGPGDAILKELAARPLDGRLEGNPHWHDVTHCSECYREFLGFRAEFRRTAKAGVAKIGVAAATAAALIVAGTFLAVWESPRPKRPQNAELVYQQRIVDLQGRAMTRSEDGKEDAKPIVLPREPEAQIIRLPFGSMEGAYGIRIAQGADHPLLFCHRRCQG